MIVSEVKYIEERKVNPDDFREPEAYDRIPIVEIYMRAYASENN